jgi:2-iminobutanoate/2-iminopropanoate deaminase
MAGLAQGKNNMLKKIDLHPDKERFRNFSFSTCVIAGDYVYTSHQGGVVDDEGKLLSTVEEQTEQAFKNLERALAAGGATLDDVMKMMIYMKNAEDFQAIEDIYKTKFNKDFPVRSSLVTGFVADLILVQMDAIAYVPHVD